ncbi:MAG TPA: hypothetical protein VMT66_17200 [Steroidobacteraceae bacterium]|nr:hypothetical protein [Steroidobacteraceae bacterium]
MKSRPGGLVCRFSAVAILAGTVLTACSRHSTPPPPTSAKAPPPFASSREEIYDPQDPCNLLEPKEVEAVLGAPLAVPPYRGANAIADAAPEGEACVYETADFRAITLEVTREGGAQAYSMTNMVKNLMKSGGGSSGIQSNVKKNFKLDDGTELAGEWDEASLTPMNCCIFNALRGDQLISIDFTSSTATLRQAAALVDTAYKRIASPLKIDGGGSVAAARAFNKTRPKPVDVCSLLTRAEVEAILGHLAKDPVAGRDACTYEVPVPPQTPPEQYELSVRWRGGYEHWRSDQHVGHLGNAAVMQIAKDAAAETGHPLSEAAAAEMSRELPGGAQDSTPQTSGTAATDPAAMVTDTGLHFAAVKRDVQVSVNNRFVDAAKAKALVAAALAKI